MLQYDLELVFVKNSHDFVHEYMKKPEYVELMRRLGALGDGNQDRSEFHVLYLRLSPFHLRPVQLLVWRNRSCNLKCSRFARIYADQKSYGYLVRSGTLSPNEWEAAYLYLSFVLKKVII